MHLSKNLFVLWITYLQDRKSTAFSQLWFLPVSEFMWIKSEVQSEMNKTDNFGRLLTLSQVTLS